VKSNLTIVHLMVAISLSSRIVPVAVAAEAPRKPLFRFGIIADVQYCDAEPAGKRFYRNSPQKLEQCVTDLNTHGLSFTIQLGDFIDRDFHSFQRVLPIYQSLRGPTYHVLGNHDFSVASEKKGDVLRCLGLERGYYDFQVNGWRFVVLDGNDLSLHARRKNSPQYNRAVELHRALRAAGRSNANTWNGGIGAEQMQWLKERLDAAEQAAEKVVLFCHYPVYPEDAHNLWNCEEIVEVLSSCDHVVAYIAGHNHGGHYGHLDGVHYLTMQGMVDTPETNAYAVAEVFPNRIEIVGVGRVPSRSLLFERPDYIE
jgi:3',5'-cyclic AMP phosphodiesterase CpdA